jgi:hypothetical protein
MLLVCPLCRHVSRASSFRQSSVYFGSVSRSESGSVSPLEQRAGWDVKEMLVHGRKILGRLC